MGAEPSLYEGDVGVDGYVETMQLALLRAGYHVGKPGADGKFGWDTVAAVKAFQRDQGFKDDGVVGNQTWAALLQRDPEPPGVNNGPHGGLYKQPHAADSGSIHGVGWEPGPATLTFTSYPTFDGSFVYVDLDVQTEGNTNLAVLVWADLYQDGSHVATSSTVNVNQSGPQTIPLGNTYPPGDYEIEVHASDNSPVGNPQVDLRSGYSYSG